MQHPADNYGMFAAAQPLPNATRRVLVIDDDPAVLKVLGLVLQRRGFSVDTMGSAKDALALVPQQKYHAILADILMTEMTGVEFLRALRRHDLDVPVILMTAGPTRDSAIDAIEYGAQQYLLKPVEPDALVQAVGRAMAFGELARGKRGAYAFCREVDDVVDECSDPQVAAAKLQWWRLELAKLYADFGDVRGDDFKAWWTEDGRGAKLFSNPPAEETVRLLTTDEQAPTDGDRLVVSVPLNLPKKFILQRFRSLLDQNHKGKRGKRYAKTSN